MSLVRWEPFGTFDDIFNRMPGLLGRWPRASLEGAPRMDWSPTVDISETAEEYLIRAELPAVKKEDVRVTFEDGMITISGERKQQEEQKDEKFHRVESFYGSFARSFGVPDNIKADAIRSEYKDGVLSVHLPKVEKEKAKQIAVQ